MFKLMDKKIIATGAMMMNMEQSGFVVFALHDETSLECIWIYIAKVISGLHSPNENY